MLSAINQADGQSFKGVNIVRVSKGAFKNPEDIRACTTLVDGALGGGGKLRFRDILKLLLGIRNKRCKVSTFDQLTNKIADVPEKEGMHTFVVLSGAENEACTQMCSVKKLVEYVKEFTKDGKKPTDEEFKEYFFKQVKDLIAGKPVNNEISVNTLEELASYKDII